MVILDAVANEGMLVRSTFLVYEFRNRTEEIEGIAHTSHSDSNVEVYYAVTFSLRSCDSKDLLISAASTIASSAQDGNIPSNLTAAEENKKIILENGGVQVF